MITNIYIQNMITATRITTNNDIRNMITSNKDDYKLTHGI